MSEISLDDDLAREYLAEALESLATVETELLAIEESGAEIDEERVNRVFRAVHSVKGGSGFFNLVNIGELAHKIEDAIAQIRSRSMVPTADRVRVLLRAIDRLSELVQNAGRSNESDIAELVAELEGLCAVQRVPTGSSGSASKLGRRRGGEPLRILLVEDDFFSRLLLQVFLSRYGECHIAVNGREAVDAVRSALERTWSYDLICMDIMMPEMDGREAVRQVRALEEKHGICSTSGAKIIMTTAVDEVKEVIRCFHELCDAYLMKPIDLTELLRTMKSHQLVR